VCLCLVLCVWRLCDFWVIMILCICIIGLVGRLVGWWLIVGRCCLCILCI